MQKIQDFLMFFRNTFGVEKKNCYKNFNDQNLSTDLLDRLLVQCITAQRVMLFVM